MNEEIESTKPSHGVTLQGQPTRYIPGPSGKVSLVNKLAVVMKHVGSVPKTGWNDHYKYKFTREDDLTNAIRDSLAEQGVMLIFGVESLSVSLVQIGSEGKKKDGYSSVILSSHMLIDGDSGEQIIFQCAGHAAKSDDKGIYSCETGAVKYSLLKTFLISADEGDPENDHNAAFTPPERGTRTAPALPDEPKPGRYRTAAEDPAVQARMAREEQEIQQEAPPERRQRGSVATTAARGGMKAEPVAPEPEDLPTGYPEWCDVVKNAGDVHKGKTLAWIALHDHKAFRMLQKDWFPKPARPGGSVAPALAALRAALDDSIKEQVVQDELKEIVEIQEGS